MVKKMNKQLLQQNKFPLAGAFSQEHLPAKNRFRFIALSLVALALAVLIFSPHTGERAQAAAPHAVVGQQESPLSPLPAPQNGAEGDALAAADEADGGTTVLTAQGGIVSGTPGNQTSLVLVGAILIGCILVAGLAIWRRT